MFQVSCGHDGQISSLRTNLETAEREIERLRGLVRDQQDDHEMYLTEMSTCFFTFAIKSTLKCGNSVKTYASILGKLDRSTRPALMCTIYYVRASLSGQLFLRSI